MLRRCLHPETKKHRVIKDRAFKGLRGEVEQTETAFRSAVSSGQRAGSRSCKHAYVPVHLVLIAKNAGITWLLYLGAVVGKASSRTKIFRIVQASL